jgi:hypothetical protein
MKRALRSATISFLVAMLVGAASGQNSEVKIKNAAAPKYKIGLKYRTVKSQALPAPLVLVLQISVNPSAFNRAAMISLANRLKNDFPKEERLHAILFSDYQTAKTFTARNDAELAAIRGDYYLDRTTGEEQISFVPDPKEPKRIVRIDLNQSE